MQIDSVIAQWLRALEFVESELFSARNGIELLPVGAAASRGTPVSVRKLEVEKQRWRLEGD